MRYRPLLSSVVLAGAVGLAGCSGGTVSGAGDGGIAVTGLDTMRFSPDTITAKAGEPVKIVFRNGGLLPHDLISEGADTNVKLANVASGRTESGVFQANKPGTYAFVCVQPGHKESGMVGKIVVE
jgi:uncharacterized cupredoxin-like copper-binding protein